MTDMMLKYHECTAKKKDEDEFKCPDCGKTYWSERMLNIHKKVCLGFIVSFAGNSSDSCEIR